MLPRVTDRARSAHRAASLTVVAMLGIVLPLFAAAIVAPTPVRGATHAVEIGDGFFSPASLSVQVGDTVTWTNVDDSPHTVSSDAFDSGNLEAGQTFSFTFTAAGTFGYVCNYHDEMTASITVTDATSGSGEGAQAPASAAPAASAAAAPAAPTHADAGHDGDQPDTALPGPADGRLMAWVAPLLIGVGLVAFAFGFVPERGTVAAGRADERRRPATGWRR
jgi:plastocyanin